MLKSVGGVWEKMPSDGRERPGLTLEPAMPAPRWMDAGSVCQAFKVVEASAATHLKSGEPQDEGIQGAGGTQVTRPARS